MKAFVSKLDVKGQQRCGGSWNSVTPNYLTTTTLLRYTRRRLQRFPAFGGPGTYLVSVYHDWSRCYGKADRVYTLTI